MAADPYEVLGVAPQATPEQITTAFRRLIRLLHPDTSGGGDSERLRQVVEAYRILRDPARRAVYDRQRRTARTADAQPRARTESGSARRPSHGRRRIPVEHRGRDAAWTVTIDAAAAAAGAVIPVAGRPGLRVRIPAGTPDGQTFRVRGRGLRGGGGGADGDLYITVHIA